MKYNSPPKLKRGDRICIISPSAGLIPFATNRSLRAKKSLENMGFEVVFAKHAKKNFGYVSASIKDRVDDIHEVFLDKKCRLVLASIGGNHSNQLLEHIDYRIIRKNPKIFCGYSDITVLHYAFLTQTNLQTYFGPCFLNQFGEFPKVLSYTEKHFKNAVENNSESTDIYPSDNYTDEVLDWFKNEDESRARTLRKNEGYSWWRSGSGEGWAFPVTIPSVNHILGTKYLPDFNKSVLLIDIPEGNDMNEGLSIASLDSWITDLYNFGVFSQISGLIIGRPYKYTKEMVNHLKK